MAGLGHIPRWPWECQSGLGCLQDKGSMKETWPTATHGTGPGLELHSCDSVYFLNPAV